VLRNTRTVCEEIGMRRRAFVGLCGAGLLALLEAPTWAWAAAESVKVGLTETTFPGLQGVLLQAATRPFRALLESATGTAGRIVHGGDARGLADRLKQDKVQLGVFHGIEFAWARLSNSGLEPIVICVNKERSLKACLLVRADSSFKRPADLRGKALAVPAQTCHHCEVFLRHRCASPGTPREFYEKLVTSADVEEALDVVVDGNAQAAVVDRLAWISYREAKPGCARKLRVLLASEPFPCAVIACQKGHFRAGRLRRLRDNLAAAGHDKRGRRLMEFLRITGFEAVPNDYDRLLTAIARAYPPPRPK
jgi:ABC-type phosphate/phosphonate transport system substrate-binding protein